MAHGASLTECLVPLFHEEAPAHESIEYQIGLERPTDRLLDLPRLHIPMDLHQIDEFPILAGCLQVWRDAYRGRLPEKIDPVDMPREAIRGISLIVLDPDAGDWIVRLASTLMDQGYGKAMTGCPMLETYRPQEYPEIRARLEAILAHGEPNLARHEFIGSQNRRWAYVRLILPLSSDGVKRDRYALIYDPATFGRRLGD